jgi:hypothetical protein
MENVYEQFFFLKYYGSWSFTEAYSLPVGLREWFVKRLVKQLEDEKAAAESAQKSSSPGSQTRQLSDHNAPRPPPDIFDYTKG